MEFSDGEVERRSPDRETLDRAVALFSEYGVLRLHRSIPRAAIEACEPYFRRRYKKYFAVSTRRDGRPLFSVDVEGPLNDPIYYANPLVFPIVERLLGRDCILGATSCVLAFPGAVDQFIHRDTQSLFGDFAHDVHFPPVALTVLMPLVDVTTRNGVLERRETHAADRWFPLLQQILGENCIVGRVAAAPVGCVAAFPALVRSLFDTPLPDVAIPCYALVLIRPLDEGCSVEIIKSDGGVAVAVLGGGALVTDARHSFRLAGSSTGSPGEWALISVYQRHWFRNTQSGRDQMPLQLSHRDYMRYSGQYQQMFAWCFDQYVAYRRQAALSRLVHRVVPPAVLERIRRARRS